MGVYLGLLEGVTLSASSTEACKENSMHVRGGQRPGGWVRPGGLGPAWGAGLGIGGWVRRRGLGQAWGAWLGLGGRVRPRGPGQAWGAGSGVGGIPLGPNMAA